MGFVLQVCLTCRLQRCWVAVRGPAGSRRTRTARCESAERSLHQNLPDILAADQAEACICGGCGIAAPLVRTSYGSHTASRLVHAHRICTLSWLLQSTLQCKGLCLPCCRLATARSRWSLALLPQPQRFSAMCCLQTWLMLLLRSICSGSRPTGPSCKAALVGLLPCVAMRTLLQLVYLCH